MKRDPRLVELSSEHHQALVLARWLEREADTWSSTQGMQLSERFARELEPHFRCEEELLLPALRLAGHEELCARVERDHALLRAHRVSAGKGDGESARSLGRLLREHVQFEERVLFPACEAQLSDDVLDAVARRTKKGH